MLEWKRNRRDGGERLIWWSAIREQVTDILIVTKRDELRMSHVVFLKTAHKEWKAKDDDFSRECLATVVGPSVSGARVVRELESLAV
jgi:hypothetical protein